MRIGEVRTIGAVTLTTAAATLICACAGPTPAASTTPATAAALDPQSGLARIEIANVGHAAAWVYVYPCCGQQRPDASPPTLLLPGEQLDAAYRRGDELWVWGEDQTLVDALRRPVPETDERLTHTPRQDDAPIDLLVRHVPQTPVPAR